MSSCFVCLLSSVDSVANLTVEQNALRRSTAEPPASTEAEDATGTVTSVDIVLNLHVPLISAVRNRSTVPTDSCLAAWHVTP